MIYFVSSYSHRYTHAVLEADLPFFRRVSYPELLTRRWAPRGVYIFSDFDRLSFWQLEVAAGLYRQLKAGGCHVLNDPARVAQRFDLLERLRRAKINSFRAWSADQADEVDVFPVFLRTQAAHRGVLTDLLETPEALRIALEGAVASGLPRRDLMIVQYCAEPVSEGLFRKLSVYRVGSRTVSACSVHERSWAAKYGEVGVAGAELYDAENQMVRDNPYGETLLPAFELAGIEYGRADFGLVDGRPQIYEINTNPSIGRPGSHPFPAREASAKLAYDGLRQAFEALDCSLTGRVRLQRPRAMDGLPRWRRFAPAYQWTP